MFIAGALMHSGLLYLDRVFESGFAASILSSVIAPVGPVLILTGLLFMGILVVIGFENRFIDD